MAANDMTAFKQAIAEVIKKAKELGIPHPKLQPHPDYANAIFSRSPKIKEERERWKLLERRRICLLLNKLKLLMAPILTGVKNTMRRSKTG